MRDPNALPQTNTDRTEHHANADNTDGTPTPTPTPTPNADTDQHIWHCHLLLESEP